MARRRTRPFDALIRHTILEYGWYIQAVGGGVCDEPDCDSSDDTEPPYAYTIGLTRFHGHPEIITFGLCPDCTMSALNTAGEAVRTGLRVTDAAVLDRIFPPGTARMIEVADSSHHLLGANRVYRANGGPPIPALQLVWADDAGRFPWDDGFGYDGQPLLGDAA